MAYIYENASSSSSCCMRLICQKGKTKTYDIGEIHNPDVQTQIPRIRLRLPEVEDLVPRASLTHLENFPQNRTHIRERKGRKSCRLCLKYSNELMCLKCCRTNICMTCSLTLQKEPRIRDKDNGKGKESSTRLCPFCNGKVFFPKSTMAPLHDLPPSCIQRPILGGNGYWRMEDNGERKSEYSEYNEPNEYNKEYNEYKREEGGSIQNGHKSLLRPGSQMKNSIYGETGFHNSSLVSTEASSIQPYTSGGALSIISPISEEETEFEAISHTDKNTPISNNSSLHTHHIKEEKEVAIPYRTPAQNTPPNTNFSSLKPRKIDFNISPALFSDKKKTFLKSILEQRSNSTSNAEYTSKGSNYYSNIMNKENHKNKLSIHSEIDFQTPPEKGKGNKHSKSLYFLPHILENIITENISKGRKVDIPSLGDASENIIDTETSESDPYKRIVNNLAIANTSKCMPPSPHTRNIILRQQFNSHNSNLSEKITRCITKSEGNFLNKHRRSESHLISRIPEFGKIKCLSTLQGSIII